ncbi:MAG: hypothetical protein DWH91_14490 [Planctomycetota bacterium]|nr:MAG: hypothetical protein DWH91_14490 [Planctomycetota bacterium]
MRETMEPALGLFAAVREPPVHELWHPSETPGGGLAVQVARRLITPPPIGKRIRSWAGYLFATALGAGLAWGWMGDHSAGFHDPQRKLSVNCTFQSRAERPLLTGVQMTQSCLACHTVPERF